MVKSIQDTIQFSLSAEETVINNTVRINATIVGMIDPDLSEQTLRDSIKGIMQNFIETEWQFANTQRTSHASGREQITLTATARVPESENYALDRRREAAAQDINGMRITAAHADTSPTAAQIEATQRKLRVAILQKAKEELKVINEALGEKYRIGDVNFDSVFDSSASNMPRGGMAMAASSAPKVNYGSGFDSANDSIGNAVKLTMHAAVQLRISR